MTVVMSSCAAALVATTSAFVFEEPGVRYAAEALSLLAMAGCAVLAGAQVPGRVRGALVAFCLLLAAGAAVRFAAHQVSYPSIGPLESRVCPGEQAANYWGRQLRYQQAAEILRFAAFVVGLYCVRTVPRSLRRRSPLERSVTLLVLVLVVLAGLSPLAEDPASSPAVLGVITVAALVWVSAGRIDDRPVAGALLVAGAGWMLPSTVFAVGELAATRDQASFPDLNGAINACVVFVSPESDWSTVLAFLEFGPMAMIFAAPAVFAGAILWLHRGAEAA
ncbi:hypothetical protein [Winogradskya humida]|uniref:hypothetical protein n=1 Tax=Winogradskya humida TaxID=113566 RepID=UPI0019447862|nr:hypothetical protein [Actinoplanes humidus]